MGRESITSKPKSVVEAKWFGFSSLIPPAAALAVYVVSISNGFVWDDEFIIVKNPAIRSLSSILEVLLSADVVNPYYRPLNRFSYNLDYWLFGLNPAGYHAINVILHLCNVVLIYRVGLKIASDKTGAVFSALLFAIHPVNSEAINFVSGRNNLFSLAFMLSSLLVFWRVEGRWWWNVFFSAVLFFFGLLSKETSIALLVLIAAGIVTPIFPENGRTVRQQLLTILPFLVCLAGYLFLRLTVLGSFLGSGSLVEGLTGRLILVYNILPRYIGLFFYPVGLTVFHNVPQTVSIASPGPMLGWLFIGVLVWRCVKWGNRTVLFGLTWFGINYLPAANVVPIPSWPMAERYMYIPFAGVCIAAGEVAWRIGSRRRMVRFAGGITFALVVCMAALTIQRNLDWRDDITLFRSAIKVDPASDHAHFNLGNAYLDKRNYQGAIGEWEKTLEINPLHAGALTQMGTVAAGRGDYQVAEQYYLAALRSEPNCAMAHYNLGKIYEKQDKRDDAMKHYEAALANLPVEYKEYQEDIERKVDRMRSKKIIHDSK